MAASERSVGGVSTSGSIAAAKRRPRQRLHRRLAIHGEPDALVMELPIAGDFVSGTCAVLAASAGRWPGAIAAYRRTGTDRFTLNRTVTAQATKGVLVEPLAARSASCPRPDYPDRGEAGERCALLRVRVRPSLWRKIVAVGDETLGWELLEFATAELTGPDTYRSGDLFNGGQAGSAPETRWPSGRPGLRFVLLNAAVGAAWSSP